MICGVFWPVHIYKAEEKQTPKKADLVTYAWRGVDLLGVIRDPRIPAPAGCIKLKERDMQLVRKVKEVASEDGVEGNGVRRLMLVVVAIVVVAVAVVVASPPPVAPWREARREDDDEEAGAGW